MGKLRPGAVEGMDDGPQNLLLMVSLCICRSKGQGLPDQLTRVGALLNNPPPFTGQQHLVQGQPPASLMALLILQAQASI